MPIMNMEKTITKMRGIHMNTSELLSSSYPPPRRLYVVVLALGGVLDKNVSSSSVTPLVVDAISDAD